MVNNFNLQSHACFEWIFFGYANRKEAETEEADNYRNNLRQANHCHSYETYLTYKDGSDFQRLKWCIHARGRRESRDDRRVAGLYLRTTVWNPRVIMGKLIFVVPQIRSVGIVPHNRAGYQIR